MLLCIGRFISLKDETWDYEEYKSPSGGSEPT
jgi:hypothetical protein